LNRTNEAKYFQSSQYMMNICCMTTKKWCLLLWLQALTYVYAQAQFNPTDFAGLQLWLRADSGLVMNGSFVSQWSDISGTNRHAVSEVDVIRPTVLFNAINGLPAVSFDGSEDFLHFDEIPDVRTVFWVLRENPGASSITSRPLLGWSGGFNFLRGDNEQLWNGLYASTQVINGLTRLNGQTVNGANAWLNPDFNVVALRTSGNIQANHLTMESNIYGRTWWGEMAEIIIFNQPLSDNEMEGVESYLFNRYASVYQPMADVWMGASLCDTTLCIPDGFSNVVWDNAINGSCLEITASGSHHVTFTDAFGRYFVDTVEVHYAIDNGILDAEFCQGNSYMWPAPEYSFGYELDGQPVPEVIVDQEGIHTIQINDESGCLKIIDLNLVQDNFSSSYQIAEQNVYCEGANLFLTPAMDPDLPVVWNGNWTSPTIQLQVNGAYTVEAHNENNCAFRDTVNITLAGSSSAIDLYSEGDCLGTSTSFSALVTSGESLISGIWDFGDEQTALGITINHTYNEPGVYLATFTGVNASGCTSYAQLNVQIHALPTLSLEAAGRCTNEGVTLQAIATSTDGEVIQYDWLVAGEFLQGPEVVAHLPLPGFNNIIVSASTEYGCISEWSQLYQMFDPPSVAAIGDTVCWGALNQFEFNVINSGSSSSQVAVAWEFGDGTGSTQPQPFHYYGMPQNYEALVVSENSEGCRDTTAVMAKVLELPEPDFMIANFCVGQEQVVLDMTVTDALDPIENWDWLVDGTQSYQGQQPLVSFQNTGLHPIQLTVTSVHGCEAEVLQQIPVWPTPMVYFSWSPLLQGAPWEVPFEATSNIPADFHWYFGDGNSGSGTSSPHLFGMNGTYNVQLTATTPQGCSSAVSQIVTVANPNLDLAIQNIQIIPFGTANQILVQVKNNGNLKLEQVLMSWQLGGDAPVIETWTANLGAGETTVFEFASRVSQTTGQYPYLCVYAETSPWLTSEINLTDNAFCKPLESGGLELFAPYPNPGDDRMFVRLIAPESGNIQLYVIDQKGQQVMVFEDLEVDKGFQQFFIDISQLANGSYRIVAEMTQARSVVSFLKMAR
jgi:PKD repeat protein